MGNALRMRGRYEDALRHLRRAERIYLAIGDIVSYSYTLWSLGMVHLMEGRLRWAEYYVKKASVRFRKTKDIRGLIYCRLALGQVQYLRGDRRGARRELAKALHASLKNKFGLERCHSRSLLEYMEKGKMSHDCYRAAGSRLRASAIPFNIP
jgi:tetratricopeptide (TPR) repeat protein